MEDSRVRKFAHFMINRAVYLQPGENVLIELRGTKPLGFLKALVEEAYKAGGKPFVHIFDFDIDAALIEGADAEHISKIAYYEVERMKDMQAYIGIRAHDNISAWNCISSEKNALYRKNYFAPIHQDVRINRTKWSVLRYPSDSMAQLARMSTHEYEDFFFTACLVDYDKMERAMKPLCALMDATDKVKITGPGTDIEFSIKNIPCCPMSGNKNIPDGEIYTAPVKNSVNGKITFNTPAQLDGFIYNDISLTFKDGKIVDFHSNNVEKMRGVLDTDEGARYVGEFALGVNPAIKHAIGDTLFDEKIAGSFHLTPGNCYENTSNGNKSAVHWDLICIQTPEYGGGEMFFDDVLIRKDGRFVIPELECLNPENL